MWRAYIVTMQFNSITLGTIIEAIDWFIARRHNDTPARVAGALVNFRNELVAWKHDIEKQEDGRR